jgi:hypothetical protein
MQPTNEKVKRLMDALRLDTPILAVYDSEITDEFEPVVRASGSTCCFAYYKQWLQGKTVAFIKGEGGFGDPKNGCYGAHASFGLKEEYPPFMAHLLTDGEGAPMGEGLKATAELAQEYLDRASAPSFSSGSALVGPLRLEQWGTVRSVTFLADPDRLSALITLASFWSSDPEFVVAPFSSGCGLMLRELEGQDRERAVVGSTDIAMRKYIPADMLSLSVLPPLFARMIDFPDNAFLGKEWWNDLMKSRGR